MYYVLQSDSRRYYLFLLLISVIRCHCRPLQHVILRTTRVGESVSPEISLVHLRRKYMYVHSLKNVKSTVVVWYRTAMAVLAYGIR